jgi:predicted outer membrane repeat protein
VYVYQSTGTFTQTGVSTITHNTANWGGGVYVNFGSATLSGGQIRSNTASVGGGVYVDFGSATLNGGQIISNTATSGGGGVYVGFNGSATLSGGQVFSNTATNDGGGIYNSGALSLANTTVSGNTASNRGGGIYNLATSVLTYTTVASNTAASGGRGIDRAGGTVLLKNTIVAYNGTTNCSGGVTSNDYNLDSGNTCGFSALHDQPNTDPLLGPLADNGGDTLTHALLEGSPAIDKGTCVAGITTDQRGVTRPQTGKCDIGAYEVEGGGVYLPIIMRNYQ